MARAKRIVKRAGSGLAGLIVIAALALGLAYAYAQTPGGRAWIADHLARLLSVPGETEVAIEGLSGRLPQAPRIAELRVSDPRGVWLRVDNLEIDWRPLALLTGTLHLRRIEAERVAVERRPEPPPDAEDETGAFNLSDLAVDIRVERLIAADVVFGEAVLGTPAAFRIEGLATAGDDQDLTASLRMVRSDGVAGRIVAKAGYSPRSRHLALDLAATEPAGGLIARALGIDGLPALDLRLTGEGPLDDWNGLMSLDLEGLARLDADMALAFDADLGFRITGRMNSRRPFTGLPWRLVSGNTAFAVDGRWRRPNTLMIDRARLKSDAVDVVLNGSLNTVSLDLDAEAEARILDDSVYGSLIEGMEIDDLSLTAVAKGAVYGPALRLHGRAAGLVLPGLESGGLALTVETRGPLVQPDLRLFVEFTRIETEAASAGRTVAELVFAADAPIDRAPLSGRVSASGTAEPIRIDTVMDWQPALGSRLAWHFDGRVDLAANEITVDRLSIDTGTLQASGSGVYALETRELRADIETDYPDLGTISAPLGAAVAGRARLKASMTVGDFGETLALDLSAALRDLRVDEPVANALLAGRGDIGATISLRPDEGLRLHDLTVETGAGTLAGTASLDPDFRRLDADYRVEMGDLGGPGGALGLALAGSATIEGRAEGALDDLGVSGRLALAQVAVDGRHLGEITVDYRARDATRQPAGRLDATMTGPPGEFVAAATYVYDGSDLRLSDLSLQGEHTQLRGRARIPVAGGPVSAEVSVEAGTLEPWLALAGVVATGRGRARLAFEADGSRQVASLDATLEGLAVPLDDGEVLRLSALTARIESRDLLDDRRGTVRLDGREFALGEIFLRTISAEATGGPAGGTIGVSAAGEWRGDLALQAEGRLSVTADRLALQVSRFGGTVFGETTTLELPLRIIRESAAWDVADLDLTYGAARLSGSAHLGAERISAELVAARVPLEAIEPLFAASWGSGLLDGSIRIDGPPDALTGRVTLEARELTLATLGDGTPLGLALNGDWKAGRLAVDGRLSGLAEDDAVLFASLPLRLDAATLLPRVPAQEAVSGRLTWQGPIAPVWAALPITGQTLAGAADLRVELSGTFERPDVAGRLTLREGAYDHLDSGTLLRDIDLLVELEGGRATLARLTADDGGAGLLSATGAVDLLPEQGFPMAFTAEIDAFHLVRRDDVTASSDGQLELRGTVRGATLSGRLETETVEVRIPDRLPAEIVDLGATEEGAAPPADEPPPQEAAGDGASRLALDVAVVVPNRAFLRGRGLDTEWSGRLAVTGTTESPEVKGKLKMLRGQAVLVGKAFRFERGAVDFIGGQTIDPLLDMKASHSAKDLVVTVEVGGRASDPSIAFGSVPELPQDEIVARLLYGKATTQLSALEAAQLAAAAAELTGAGGGGLLEGVRRSLGVDVLRVETTGEGDAASAAIAAGKYVTEGIYLGISKGTAAESGTVQVEVEVSPHIVVDTEVDQTGNSEVGIKFKWDY